MFRPVDDGTIAQVIDRIEKEKMRQAQLSASSAALVSSSEQSVVDESRALQLLAENEAMAVSTAASHESVQSPGWWLPLLLYFLNK